MKFSRENAIFVRMKGRKLIWAALAGLLFVSCSTTRVLKDGEYLLAKNDIKVDDGRFNTSELNSYLRQKSSTFVLGFNPLISIYNWGGTSERPFARFIRKFGTAPVVYQAAQVDESISNMLNHLEYIGYYGSEIESRVAVKGRKVYVTYYVTLGNRYKISDIDFDIPSYGTFAEDFEADKKRITVKPGQYLSESALEAESVRSSQYFRNIGYYGLTKGFYFFEADTLSSDGNAHLTMSIRDYTRNDVPDNAVPHRKYTIGNVTVSHPASLKIRPSVVENLNTLRPGDPYSEREVNTTYNRLSSVGMLSSVNVNMRPVSDDVVDCDITLQNSGLQGFKTNLEASVNSTGLVGISPQLSYYHKNIFHGGELLNLGLKGNFQFKPKDKVRSTELSASGSIRFPKFIGLPNRIFKGPNLPHTDISAAFSYQNRPEYRRTMISTSFGYTGNLGRRFFYQIYPFRGNIVRLFDIDSTFMNNLLSNRFMMNAYSDHFDLGVGGTLYYTTDASAIPSRSFHFYRLSVDVSGNVVSLFNPLMPTDEWGDHTVWDTPYAQYVRAEVQAGRTVRFGKGERFALAYRLLAGAGHAYGNSSTLPFEKQFYSGGAGSMRGWQARSLGPGNSPMYESFVIPSQTGDMKLEANVEMRFPLVWKLEGALFADAGNIWDLGDLATDDARFSLGNLRESIGLDWGLGIRVNLSFILVRVDAGIKLHDPALEAGSRWLAPGDWLSRGNYAIHFGVGYPF